MNSTTFKNLIKIIISESISSSLFERTLYHGTVIDNEESIRKIGLMPSVGDFIKQMYDEEESEIDEEENSLVYAADKESLQKSLNAITAQVGKKLNKPFHDVTENDIRNHGLLAVIKSGDELMNKAPSREEYHTKYGPHLNYRFLEPEDWYTQDLVGVDYFLKGSKLINFFKKYSLSFNDMDAQKTQLLFLAKKVHPEKTEEELKLAIKNISKNQLNNVLKNYKRFIKK